MSQTDSGKRRDAAFEKIQPLIEMIESSDSVFWITALGSSQLLYISPSASEIFGRSAKKLMADKKWRAAIIDSRDQADVKSALGKLKEGDKETLLYRVQDSEGNTRWIEDRITVYSSGTSASKDAAADPDQKEVLIGGIAVDVTERVLKEQHLSQAESAYKSLAESIPMSVIRKDLEGRILFANQRYCRAVGRAVDELIGMTNFDLFPAERARVITQQEKDMLEQGALVHTTEKNQRASGTVAYIEVFKSPVTDEQGDLIGFQIVHHDISENKHLEEASDRERYLLKALLDAIPHTVYFKDERSRFIRVSQSMVRQFGLTSADELIGKSDADFMQNVEERLQDEQALFNGDIEIVEKEETEVWADGTETWSLTTKLPLKDMSGKHVGTFGLSRCITDRKLAEAELERERDLLKTIIDNVPDLVYLKDRYGRFVNGNKALQRALRVSSVDEIIGKTDYDFWPPELSCNYVADDQVVMRDGEPLHEQEESFQDMSGKKKWFLTSKVPLFDTQGKVKGLVGISRDITKSTLVKEQLSAAKDAADAANNAKSDFLANMSHEIRTPMNAIIGMTELLMDSELKPQQFDYLKMIQDSGESLLRVINDILDFSKIEAGKLELDRVDFALRRSIGGTMKSLAMRAHAKSLELAFRVQPDVPETLHGDIGRLRQIIVNLVGNAIKFTERGEVVVDIGVNKTLDDSIELLVKVRDTGIGMTETTAARVFDEFEQADTSTTRQYGGTGLGLAISSRLVTMMNGRIWVQSAVAKGSEFQFTVELGRSDQADSPPMPVIVGGMRVLVVDDNETNRLILQEMLTSWGMRPVTTPDAESAMALLKANAVDETPFQLVLSDVHMPNVDGFMLAERIRSVDSIRSVPIVLLTSGTRMGDVELRDRLDIADFLMKPVTQNEVFETIVDVLGGNGGGYVSESVAAETKVAQPLDVLLVEDNKVNQKLATSMLKKHGHRVQIATNGQEALERTKHHRYDLVLMDVQMPVMDGLEATRQIRAREKGTSQHQIIVAMTAHAMKGDKDLCLSAGMDDYLSKPIRMEVFAAKLQSIFGDQPSNEAADEFAESIGDDQDAGQLKHYKRLDDETFELPPADDEQAVVSDRQHVDWPLALKSTGNDRSLLKELVQLFLDELPRLIDGLAQGIEKDDAKEVKRVAHMLKGSMLFLNTKLPFASSSALEVLGDTDNLAEAPVVFAEMKTHLDELVIELKDYVRQS